MYKVEAVLITFYTAGLLNLQQSIIFSQSIIVKDSFEKHGFLKSQHFTEHGEHLCHCVLPVINRWDANTSRGVEHYCDQQGAATLSATLRLSLGWRRRIMNRTLRYDVNDMLVQ